MKKKVLVSIILMMLFTTGLVFADVTVSSTAPTTWEAIKTTAFTWFGRIYNVLIGFVIFKGFKRGAILIGEFQDQESDEQGSKQQKKILTKLGFTATLIIATPLFKFLIVNIAQDMGISMNLVW